MSNYLLTGSNRGIGLEICRQLHHQGHQVWAVCRQASTELKDLPIHLLEGFDVASPKIGEQLSLALGDQPLDGVINNAGVFLYENLESLDFASIEKQMQINAYGPLRVVHAALPLLSAGAKILMITSQMGSIADNQSGAYYGYRMSKAALNMASMSLRHDLAQRGIAVAVVHPGYVRTDMTKGQGNIDARTSAAGILQRLEALNLSNSGTFWNIHGQVLPW